MDNHFPKHGPQLPPVIFYADKGHPHRHCMDIQNASKHDSRVYVQFPLKCFCESIPKKFHRLDPFSRTFKMLVSMIVIEIQFVLKCFCEHLPNQFHRLEGFSAHFIIFFCCKCRAVYGRVYRRTNKGTCDSSESTLFFHT